MQNFVGWKDYEGLAGFGTMGSDEIADLRKALTAGASINAPAFNAGEGFALRVESLERTLRITTYKMDDVRLWQAITKLPAYNTVEEFNRLESYGSGMAAFVAEGDLPEGDDSVYSRQYTVIKFAATTRAVTHVMSLIRPAHGNVIAQETVNGTAWLLRQIERKLFFGDHTMVPVEWDGLVYQITNGAPNSTLNVIDMQNRPLSEDAINDGCLIVKSEPNYGRATDLHCADGAYSDLAKGFYPGQQYVTPPGGWQNGMVGMHIQGFYSQFGPIKFNPNVFIQFGALAPTSAVGNTAKRPSAPTESSVPTGTGSAGHFGATYAGAHYYKVCAVNRYGRSAPLTMTGPVSPTATQSVTMAVADGSVTGTCFEVYRTQLPGDAVGTCKYMTTVARTGVTTTILDHNDDIPGTSKAVLIQQNLEFFSFKQLAPFMKIPLATVDLSIRWVQAIYGAPTVYTPGRAVIYKNIGRAPGSVGLNNAVA